MSLRNEIFEGLAAAQAAKRLVYDPREWYAEELYKAARRKNALDEEVDANRKKAKEAGPPTPLNPQYSGPPTQTSGTVTTLANPSATAAPAPQRAMNADGGPFRYDATGAPLPAVDPFRNSIFSQRGGRVKRFADGGYVGGDPDAYVDPDTIVGEMTQRALAPAGADPVTGEYPGEERRGPPPSVALDTRSRGQRASQGGIDPKTGQPFGGAKYGGAKFGGGQFGASRTITPEERQETEERIAAETGPLPGERGGGPGMRGPERSMPGPFIPKGSKADRALGLLVNPSINPFVAPHRLALELAPHLAPPPDALDQYARDQERIRIQNAGPSIFATPEEEKAAVTKQKEDLAKLDKEKALKTAPATEVPLERPKYATEPEPLPTLGDIISREEKVKEQFGPTRQGQQEFEHKPIGQNGPIVPNKNTPGGIPGSTTATPPPGAAPANTPTNVTKPSATPSTTLPSNGANVPMAPGSGGTRVPKGSLTDQTRTEAFGSVPSDANDPAKYVNFDGSHIRQVIGGAMQYANANGPPTVLGEGATSRGALHSYIAAHNAQARFSPGEAMLAGMISDYRTLLSQGRIEEANRMAYGLIQAATLEAASFGKSAMEMMRQGNFQTAAQQFIKGINYFPDGMTHTMAPDGRTVVTTNNRGEVTAKTIMTPQMLLQAVGGLADGSMFWQTLQAAAATVGKDKNAKLRGLNERLRELQIEGAGLRNNLLRNPRPRSGGRQPKVISDAARSVYGSDAPKDNSGADGNGDGSSDSGPIDTSYIDQPIEEIPDE